MMQPQSNREFSYHYAFCLTESTSAVLISITRQLSEMFDLSPYILLIALAFSKVFDAVRNAYLSLVKDILTCLLMPVGYYVNLCALLNCETGREDSRTMDCTGGNCLQEVYLSV